MYLLHFRNTQKILSFKKLNFTPTGNPVNSSLLPPTARTLQDIYRFPDVESLVTQLIRKYKYI